MKIEIELTEEQAAAIAEGTTANYATSVAAEQIKTQAQTYIAAKVQNSFIGKLSTDLDNVEIPEDKSSALMLITGLKELLPKVEDAIAKIGLHHELHVNLSDGRFLDTYGTYSDYKWISSSDRC